VTNARRPLALVAWLIWSAACRPATSQVAPAGIGLEHADTVGMLMGDELRAARDAGASEARLGLTGTGIPGDSLGGVIDLGKDDCALVLARGTAGIQDVDVFAFAEDGTVLGSDESPAQQANLLLCPPRPARAFVSGRVAAGFGLFGVTAQTFPRDQAGAVGKRFGISLSRPTQARELDSNWPGLDERLAEHRRRLGGTWESLRKVALPLDPRVYVSVSTQVEADRCIDLLVSPSDEVAHVDLEILEASGRWIGSGQARGADRHLMLCSTEQRELLIRCRPHAGRGLAALVISRSTQGAPQELGDNSARFDLRPAGDLAALREQLALQLERSGYGPATLVRRGNLQPERRISLPLSLARGCSRVDVLTAAPLRELRAWLWDASGQLLSQTTRGISGTLFTCGDATSARLDLETAARGGPFLAEVRHAASAPELAERHRLGIGRLLSLMNAKNLVPSLTWLPSIRAARVSEDELARFSLTVPAGRCLEVSAALDRGASGLEVRLFEETASVTGEVSLDDGALGYGVYAASARLCAVKPARSRLLTAELRANVGRGTALWATREFELAAEVKGPQAR
jgi:hypothetical protein